jgi:hypothetical protein
VRVSVEHRSRGWCKPSEGRGYAGNVSRKKFYSMLHNGLRHVRLPNGRILTKFDWIDAYLEQFEVRDQAKQMADELTEGL